MFYPELTRRENYPTKGSGGYYKYDRYRTEITEDCQERCVYCDIALKEMGYEGMQLDHFVPQDLDQVDSNDPTNIVLSCPKCNRLKSNHWPENPSISFHDPFTKNRKNHYVIKDDGVISDNNCTRTEFKIVLLSLNRPARKELRRSRFTQQRINNLLDIVDNKLLELKNNFENLPRQEVHDGLTELLEINGSLRSLLTEN